MHRSRTQTPISPKPDIVETDSTSPNGKLVRFIGDNLNGGIKSLGWGTTSTSEPINTVHKVSNIENSMSKMESSIPLNIRFFSSKEKIKMQTLRTKAITETDFETVDVKKYGKQILWLIGRQIYQPKCNEFKFGDVQKAYAEALMSLVSFQFVIGQKFVLPIFSLGSLDTDTKDPKFCNDPRNREYKFVVVDREDTRKFVSDMILLFHIKSDINDEGISLICGEILQRAGRGNYRPLKFMLVKLIYQLSEKSPKIETFINSLVNDYLKSSIFKYCLTSKENYEKYVDWITNY